MANVDLKEMAREMEKRGKERKRVPSVPSVPLYHCTK